MWKNMVERGSKVERDRPQMATKKTRAVCVLDNLGYRHTLILWNTYCSSKGKENSCANARQSSVNQYCRSCWIIESHASQISHIFLISNFCRVLNVVCFLLGNSSASEFYMPTFRSTLFHLHRQVGAELLGHFVVCFLLGNSSASEFYMPTFRSTLFHLHRQVGAEWPSHSAPTCLW
jgi:hypothetical protein